MKTFLFEFFWKPFAKTVRQFAIMATAFAILVIVGAILLSPLILTHYFDNPWFLCLIVIDFWFFGVISED